MKIPLISLILIQSFVGILFTDFALVAFENGTLGSFEQSVIIFCGFGILYGTWSLIWDAIQELKKKQG